MSVPKISILLSVRNEEKYLTAALDSVLGQSFQSWELIAVDDGSTDATFAILELRAAQDARVHIWCSWFVSVPRGRVKRSRISVSPKSYLKGKTICA